MALFVDGPAFGIDDLTDQDSALLDIALDNDINVTTKMSLALDEIKTDLQLWLLKLRPTLETLWIPALRVEQIVVTPALKRWETMHALALVYRDAYFSQLVDRYQAKWQEYAKLARDARESFIATGMSLVNDPVPQALPPALTSTPAPQSGGTFYASVAWVNAAGQEGAASAASSITIADGNVMVVSGVNPPPNATGFRVYAGPALAALYLQNQVLLPVGAVCLYIPGLITHGPLPGPGQKADFVRPMARTLLRG
ncbi:MAG TPA: hypothetical protein VG273_21670 [Bryobacteraceae bacterium]|jgi:hypothetical protein|nr:hypothetical protein [Bryobacteraceae bacterium]